jgi:hypothetical protein
VKCGVGVGVRVVFMSPSSMVLLGFFFLQEELVLLDIVGIDSDRDFRTFHSDDIETTTVQSTIIRRGVHGRVEKRRGTPSCFEEVSRRAAMLTCGER